MANVTFKTSREFYNAIATGGDITEAMQDYAKAAIKAMDEKNKARRENQSPNQKANTELAEKILAFMERDKVYTAKELATAFGVSTQKIGGVLGKTVDKELVPRVEGLEIIPDFIPEGGKAKDKCKGYTLAE